MESRMPVSETSKGTLLDEPSVYAFTGHRPPRLNGYGSTANQRLVEFATEVLQGLHPAPTEVIIGGALGFDLAVGEAALGLGWPLTVAVPFLGQESTWQSGDRTRYWRILNESTEVIHVSDPPFTPGKMEKRNRWMVDRAGKLVALWDRGSYGGTWRCVKYAESVGLEVENVWDKWLQFRKMKGF